MPIRVLLVEDNRPLRELNRRILEAAGRFEVVGQAENGMEAIRNAEKSQPDVILLDLAMPGVSGFDALPELRRVAPESIIIALSMLDRATAAPRAIALGAHAFLDKGMPDEELPRRVLQVLIENPAPVPPRNGPKP